MRKHREDPNPGGELNCFGVEPRLEAYVDEDLPPSERAALERHLEGCPACTDEFHLAQRIRGELRELPEMSCPPAVTRAVFNHAESHPPLAERLARFWGARRVWQPAFALLVVTALGVGYWRLAGPLAGPGDVPDYTEQEIAQAEAELKLALAVLGNIGQKARNELGTELSERVVAPFSRSIAGALLPIPMSPPSPAAEGGEVRDVS